MCYFINYELDTSLLTRKVKAHFPPKKSAILLRRVKVPLTQVKEINLVSCPEMNGKFVPFHLQKIKGIYVRYIYKNNHSHNNVLKILHNTHYSLKLRHELPDPS
jgi:hypothetical protein